MSRMQSPGANRVLEPFEISVPDATLEDLRERLRRARWPDQPGEAGWSLGTDYPYVRQLCRHWAERYDWRSTEARLNGVPNHRWRGLHFIRVGEGAAGVPVLLLHGWPSGPLEYLRAAVLLAEAGHEAIVPSLPGFAWSEDAGEPLNVEAVAARLSELAATGLGLAHYAVAGGDWGAMVGARMAFAEPDRIVALYVSTPGTLPVPGDLTDPPLSDAEERWADGARRWQRREGHHMVIQSAAPDVVAAGLNDSPAGLAAYLVEKYRRWSDCDGDVEQRFSKDDLCDFLTMFWATGSIASSMRLYLGERRGRWRLAPGEAVRVPAAVAAFRPGMRPERTGAGEGSAMLGNPPREWTQRLFSDLRRWREMPRGGHFSAFEEPELYVEELREFLAEMG